jgi:hypothetical protein
MNLLSSSGKRGVRRRLLSLKVDIEDILDSSKYFDVVELDPVFTAGRNPVAFNGSALLKDKSEIEVECLDSSLNPLYFEQAKSKIAQFTDVANYVISIHVYDETYNGPGKLVIVGTTVEGKSVRWIKNISIDKALTNARKVRFYEKPKLEIQPLLYPVVDLELASQDAEYPGYRTATATATIRGFVSTITVTRGGSAYLDISPPQVTIYNGGTGVTEVATAVATVVAGSVTLITITDPGSGYTSNPNVSIARPYEDAPNQIRALAVADIISEVDTLTITDEGLGYSATPTVTISGGGGGGANAVATINSEGVVDTLNVVDENNRGDGFTSAPTVTISDPIPVRASDLNLSVIFTGSFYSLPLSPRADTKQVLVDKKRTEIDYRIIVTSLSDELENPNLIQTGSFNSQMVGKDITLMISQIQAPLSFKQLTVDITQSFKIKDVLNSTEVALDEPFYYQIGSNNYVAKITNGNLSVDYTYIKYNTNPDSNLTAIPGEGEDPVSVKEPYVEATYRNLKTFSGFVARHKLYRRSLFYPGEFQLLSDEPLNSVELLTDTVTFNRAYYHLGQFSNQFHINKYWWPSTDDITLEAVTNPINAMRINSGNPVDADGEKWVIVKTDTIGQTNDNIYYPYDEAEFAGLSGISYNSNFINLKKSALHLLSTNIIIEKEQDSTARVEFYFTSSIESMVKEKEYNPNYGWKLGEVSTDEKTDKKYFKEAQELFFTPTEDYFGTLKIVPYNCNVILSDLSLKVYGDTGFSPETLVIRVLCPLNVSNEAFEFQAELYDINHILIPAELKEKKGFNTTAAETSGAGTSVVGVSDTSDTGVFVSAAGEAVVVDSDTLTVNGSLYLPNLTPNCSPTDYNRLVTWNGTNGALERTDIVDLYHDDGYVVLRTGDCNSTLTTPVDGKSLNVIFDGLTGGRQIYWVTGTTKTMDSSSN